MKITPHGQIVILGFRPREGQRDRGGEQTAAKSIFGYSRNYASLEQIQGTGTDPRSDSVFARRDALSPRDQYPAGRRFDARDGGLKSPARSARSRKRRRDRPFLAGVAAILQIAMSLNASSRPASAAEMREMLARSRRAMAELARKRPLPQRLRPASTLRQPTKLMPGTTRQAG